MSTIVSSFAGVGGLDKPVIDRTGMGDQYDFVLDFLPNPPPNQQAAPDAEGPDFVGALRSQLGIRLVSDKEPMEFVLVDRIEKPTPN